MRQDRHRRNATVVAHASRERDHPRDPSDIAWEEVPEGAMTHPRVVKRLHPKGRSYIRKYRFGSYGRRAGTRDQLTMARSAGEPWRRNCRSESRMTLLFWWYGWRSFCCLRSWAFSSGNANSRRPSVVCHSGLDTWTWRGRCGEKVANFT